VDNTTCNACVLVASYCYHQALSHGQKRIYSRSRYENGRTRKISYKDKQKTALCGFLYLFNLATMDLIN